MVISRKNSPQLSRKVMVWGCFSSYGVGALHRIKGIMKKENYPQILNGNNFIFQHDNDSKHTSNVVKNYLQDQGIEVLPYPPQSSDSNTIENLLSETDRHLQKRKCNSEEDLLTCLEKKWEHLNEEAIFKSLWKACQTIDRSAKEPMVLY